MPHVQLLRRSGRTTTVEFDSGQLMRCTHEFAQRARLAVGQPIEEVLLNRLRLSAGNDLAVSEAQHYARRGRHNRQQIAARLVQDGLDRRDVFDALDRLCADGELDDHALAHQIARRELQKLIRRQDEIDHRQIRRQQIRRLIMRGFSASDATDAVNDALAQLPKES